MLVKWDIKAWGHTVNQTLSRKERNGVRISIILLMGYNNRYIGYRPSQALISGTI